jgi:hypothetical protein
MGRKKATKKVTEQKATKTAKPKAKAKKTTAKKPGRKKGGNGSLLVASKTKEILKSYDCNIGNDAMDGLQNWVNWLIAQAAHRAHANGRKTVRAHDFLIMS